MTTFDGKVEDIVYLNEETGYTVLNFSADDQYFTAVGIFPLISEGEMLRITGEFKVNSRFGEQFVVERVEFSKPDDLQGIVKFLSGGLFRGIGAKTAADIVRHFGLETLEILDEHPERLCEVRGIGVKKCMEIIQSYKQSRSMKEAVLFLQKYDISMGLAIKIYKKYENLTVNIVRDNPYILVEDIDGVGFLTADKIASKMGIDKHNPFRVRAGILHALSDAAHSGGHTCLPVDMLIEQATRLLGVSEEECREVLPTIENIRLLMVDGVQIAADRINYAAENAIAAKIIRLVESVTPIDISIGDEIEAYERMNGIVLADKQKEAIACVLSNGVTVITGGPGTGKTTIIKGVVSILRQRRKRIMLSAPTGRACKRIYEATGEEAKTIHRLLGIDYTEHSCYDENNPLPVDVLIVDEISMADIYIFNTLLKALQTGTRLVLVGDKDQLPSVSCGNILADVIGSGLVRTVCLTDVYRQSEGSRIVTNAHRINSGLMPEWKGAKDFFFIRRSNADDIVNEVVGLVKKRLPEYLRLTPGDVQVLAPMKKSITGVENLNRALQSALNPSGKEKQFGENVFRVGDRVMQTTNDYNMEWERDNGEKGSGVFNGDLGQIIALEPNGFTVLFEDGKRAVYPGDTDEIMLAYCVSVHKSQGSEFPVVVLVLTSGSYTLLTRNLLYTAVTRAKTAVVIVGEETLLQRMVENAYTAKRYSLLKHLLLQNRDRYAILWGRK